jgi:hypothetical protein
MPDGQAKVVIIGAGFRRHRSGETATPRSGRGHRDRPAEPSLLPAAALCPWVHGAFRSWNVGACLSDDSPWRCALTADPLLRLSHQPNPRLQYRSIDWDGGTASMHSFG